MTRRRPLHSRAAGLFAILIALLIASRVEAQASHANLSFATSHPYVVDWDMIGAGEPWDRNGIASDPFALPGRSDFLDTASPFELERSSSTETVGFGRMFLRGWAPITAGEFALLGITAALPRKWTGWSDDFVADGMGNLKDAWSHPPVMDDDTWIHNYVGHPYGGSLYYNTVRSQGASVPQSIFFSFVLSTQWEYAIEAVAEQPSIQDMIITPVAGSILGEIIHSATLGMKRGGTNTGEKVLITIINPMHVLMEGYD